MGAKRKTDLLPGTLDLLVLKTLEDGARHGYSIARRIAATSDRVLLVEEGSLYPALHRLEQRGFVQASWGTSESNRRAKFYELTRRGRRQLEEQLALWERMQSAIRSVLEAPGEATA